MENKEIIVLQSAYNKTPGQVYYIQPCVDPETGEYPDCVRGVDNETTHHMILSESDKEEMKRGVVFIPVSRAIKVQHGTTFDMSIPRQRAEWEAIKNSTIIAKDRFERNSSGNLVVDGERPYVTDTGMVKGSYGKADLYIYRPGAAAKSRNTMKELIYKATGLVLNDPQGLSGWVTKCKLLEKDMSHSPESDVKDYLLTQAEKFPEKIIELYTGNTTAIRLLLMEAVNKNIVVKRQGLLIYADDVVLGASMDSAVAYLSQPEHTQLKNLIQQETFPDLFKVTNPDAIAAFEAKKAKEAVKEAPAKKVK